MSNQNDVMNQLEDIIVQVLQKNGVLNNTHEFGIVIKPLSDHMLLVAPQQFDKDPEEIPCAVIGGGYRQGDRVLIEYLNNNQHNKYVICVMQRGFERGEIDYSRLRDTPLRVFRRPGQFIQDPTHMVMDFSDIPHEPSRLAWKILFDERSPMEWWIEIHRDARGWCRAITTFWPPNGMVRFTNFVVRDSDDLLHYFGPDANTTIWASP